MSIGRFCENEEAIRKIRHAVFVREQGVPEVEEFVGDDGAYLHAVASVDGKSVGTGRLGRDGRIGRMAVLKDTRGKGIGKAILLALEQNARHWDLDEVWAHAQLQATGFYERLGYRATGDVFMEAGIPHRLIRKSIRPDVHGNGPAAGSSLDTDAKENRH